MRITLTDYSVTDIIGIFYLSYLGNYVIKYLFMNF